MNRTINLSFAIGMMCVLTGTLLTSCNQKKEEKAYRPFGRDTTYVNQDGAHVVIRSDDWDHSQTRLRTYNDTITEGDVVVYLKKEEWAERVKDKLDTSVTTNWWIDQVRIGSNKIYPYDFNGNNVQVENSQGTSYFKIKGDTIKEVRFSLRGFDNRDVKPSERDRYYRLANEMTDQAEPILRKAIAVIIKIGSEKDVSYVDWNLN